MTIDDALAQLPKKLHSTYRAFIADYEAACVAATNKKFVNHAVFVALLKSGRWRKLIA
jgi:hypothetical protein